MESWGKRLKPYEQIWKPLEKDKTYQLIGKLRPKITTYNILRPHKNNLWLVHTYNLWSSVLHDDKFGVKHAKLASMWYSFTCPACSVLLKRLANSEKKLVKGWETF